MIEKTGFIRRKNQGDPTNKSLPLIKESFRILLFLAFFLSLYFMMFSIVYANDNNSGDLQKSENASPNILLIVVDDLKPALGVYNDPIAVTPEIDKLAGKGMRFDRAYSNQAVCAPSRYNLMLGSRSTSTGIYHFGRNFRDFYPDAVTLPQYFMENGYHAESMGKVYHVGHNTYSDQASWSRPPHHDKLIEYLELESTGGTLTREEALFSNFSWGYARSLPRGAAWESPDVEDDAYADGRIAQKAIERLRSLKENSEKPFFLAVGFARPHLPFSAPQKYWDLYDPDTLPMPDIETVPEGAPDYAVKRDGEIVQYDPIPHSSEADPFPEKLTQKLIHGYYASTSYVDAQIGKVIEELETLGLDENTIIVLWGDHGFHLGELGIWTKHVNYELANHIPLIISVPGVTTPGTSTEQLSETVDIYPTLVDLAGLSQPNNSQPMDGVSLAPVLKDPDKTVRDYAYHAFDRGGRMGRAIRTDRYRLVEWKEIGAPRESADIELYEYSDGPVEARNVAADYPDVVKELRAILDDQPEAHPVRPESTW